MDNHPLKDLAIYAAEKRIYGKSYKRNSLLKPLDIVLTELDRCPDIADPHELTLVYTGTQGLLYDHLERIRKIRWEERAEIYRYVDLFFKDVLKIDLQDETITGKSMLGLKQRVDELLQRERLIRSAYLVSIRQEIDRRHEVAAKERLQQGQARSLEEAMQTIAAEEEVEEAGDEA